MITKSTFIETMHWVWAILIDSLAIILNALLSLTFFLKYEWKKNKSGTPILLVHGYLNNHSAWVFHGNLLQKRGIGPIYTVHLGPFFDSIEKYADRIAKKARQIAAENKREDLILVGYSLGGLVSAYYAAEVAKKGTVKKIITIASPLKGTVAAHIALGRSGREMLPGSRLIEVLNADIFYRLDLDFYHIATYMDLFVRPYDSAILRNNPEKEYIVRNVGHAAMLYSWRVNRKLAEWLV